MCDSTNHEPSEGEAEKEESLTCRPSLVGWRPSLFDWRPLLLGTDTKALDCFGSNTDGQNWVPLSVLPCLCYFFGWF